MNTYYLSALDEQFKYECKVINLSYEYPGYTGKEKWAIITDLTEKELIEKYDEKAELDSLALKIRKLKHAINLFNTTTVIPGYDITIDEMLVFLPQLSAKKQKLSEMASRLPKAREEQEYGRASNIIDYRYVNYDIDEVTKDLLAVTDELSDAQLALDLINHSATFEVEL